MKSNDLRLRAGILDELSMELQCSMCTAIGTYGSTDLGATVDYLIAQGWRLKGGTGAPICPTCVGRGY